MDSRFSDTKRRGNRKPVKSSSKIYRDTRHKITHKIAHEIDTTRPPHPRHETKIPIVQ